MRKFEKKTYQIGRLDVNDVAEEPVCDCDRDDEVGGAFLGFTAHLPPFCGAVEFA